MIGNDIVDLELAKTESNWQRKGFLNKIFTDNEINLIQKSKNQELMVWNLWSRKEAAYKIWNRQTGIRKYNPVQFECLDIELEIGFVVFKKELYFTKTEVSKYFIHTISVLKKADFKKIETLKNSTNIIKKNRIPFYFNQELNILFPISKSHHGNFEKIVSLSNPKFSL